MSTVNTRPTNGVSYGYVHTVTAGEESDGEITFDFQVDYYLSASVTITRSDARANNDELITYPAKGQVKIANGSTFALTEDDVISVVAQRDAASGEG